MSGAAPSLIKTPTATVSLSEPVFFRLNAAEYGTSTMSSCVQALGTRFRRRGALSMAGYEETGL
jgi:hypothetical protein